MTPSPLESLQVWRDLTFRSVPEQMAIDEALLARAIDTGRACARFYHWDHPARTIGYFSRAGDVEDGIDFARRLTGGGIVEHGEDLTFLLVTPPGAPVSGLSAEDRYRWIHEALALALADAGVESRAQPQRENGPNIPDSGVCFASPVPWDLIGALGEKLAGGAQRRSRGALIHQGSVRLSRELRHPEADWIDGFLTRLSRETQLLPEEEQAIVLDLASTKLKERYGRHEWNHRR